MKTERWVSPHIEEVFQKVRSSELFTTLDLFSGYWQIRMAISYKEITTCTTGCAAYHSEVMLFGLVVALSTFRRLMDVVIQSHPFARVYIDDLLCFLVDERTFRSPARDVSADARPKLEDQSYRNASLLRPAFSSLAT